MKDTTAKAVIFDVGGVLLDYDRDMMLRDVADRCGGEVNAEDVAKLIKRLDLSAGVNTLEDFYGSAMDELSFDATYEDLKNYWVAGLRKRDWVDTMIRSLAEKTPLYILSDTNSEHWRYITEHILPTTHFRRIFLSHELNLTKTSARVFEHVLRNVSHAARECLFIDDTFANVKLAETVGFKAHHFVNRDAMERAITDHLD